MQRELIDITTTIKKKADSLPLHFRFIELVNDDEDDYIEKIFENPMYQSGIVIANPFFKNISGI